MAIGSQDLQFNVLAKVFGEQAIQQFKNTIDQLGNTAKKADQGMALLTKAAKALGVAFTIKEAVSFGKSLLDTADNLRNVSQQTGLSVKTLDGLKGAAEQADVPFDSLTTSLSKFSKNIVEAKNGNREIQAAFKNLGVSITDATGKLRPSGDVIKNVADRFQNLKDGPEKAAIAMKIFGKSGAELIPILNEGGASLSKFGSGFTDDFADRADKFNDTLSELGNKTIGQGLKLIEPLISTLQQIAESFISLVSGGEDFSSIMVALGEALRIATISFNTILLPIVSVGDLLVSLTKIVGDGVIKTFQALGTIIGGVAASLGRLATGDFAGAREAFAGTAVAVKNLKDEFNANSIDTGKAFFDRLGKRADDYSARVAKLSKDSIVAGLAAGKTIEQILKDQEAATKVAPRDQPKKTVSTAGLGGNEQRDKLEEFLALQRLENTQRRDALDDIGRERGELAKLTETRKLETEIKRVGNSLSKDQRAELEERIKGIRQERLELIDQAEQQRQSYGAGAKQAFRDYVDSATDAASQTRKLFSQAFQNIEDSLTSFVKTGTLDFKKFADDIITELIRIQVRALIVKTITGIGSLFSGGGAASVGGGAGQSISPNIVQAKGGVVNGYGEVSLRSYAAGGIARRPQLALFGENSQAEAFVPLPDGRRIPVALEGGGGGGGTVVNVNVNMETGSSTTESTKEDGRALGGLIAAAVQKELVKQKLPGGILAS